MYGIYRVFAVFIKILSLLSYIPNNLIPGQENTIILPFGSDKREPVGMI